MDSEKTKQRSDPLSPFFLFIGSTAAESATSSLKAAKTRYQQKRLESGPENWKQIISLIRDPDLIGVVGKFTSQNFSLFVSGEYRELAESLLKHLKETQHVIFVHEAVLAGRPAWDGPVPEPEDESYIDYLVASGHFDPPPDAVREQVLQWLSQYEINVVPYETNAELSVLAAAFVDDHEKQLLLRVYIPRGRIYAAEADKVLAMFREWLTRVKDLSVREDGYETARGRVYEFFGDDSLGSSDLSDQFRDFSQFLELCSEQPDKAVNWLESVGMTSNVASDIVTRYSKETRRLELDLRHSRETKLLAVRQRLESEIVDYAEADQNTLAEADRIVQQLVPGIPSISAAIESPIASQAQNDDSRSIQVKISQQFIGSVEGTVIQEVLGTANLGVEAKELLGLIQEHGKDQATQLESSVHELEDSDARLVDRIAARQRLKGFLMKLGGKVEETALAALQQYVQNKIGAAG